jgi:hypothetical protein
MEISQVTSFDQRPVWSFIDNLLCKLKKKNFLATILYGKCFKTKIVFNPILHMTFLERYHNGDLSEGFTGKLWKKSAIYVQSCIHSNLDKVTSRDHPGGIKYSLADKISLTNYTIHYPCHCVVSSVTIQLCFKRCSEYFYIYSDHAIYRITVQNS